MVRISVTIATYNRSEQLERTLRSLLSQSLAVDLWEVVVVNNNSTDNTSEMFEKFVEDNPSASNMRMVFEPRQGLSFARNRSVEEATGEYIVIIDDDVEANHGFVEAYLDMFDSYPEADAAGGEVKPLYEFEPPRWLSPYAERPIAGTLDLGDKIVEFKKNAYPTGANMAMRRSAFDRYGMFDTRLGRTGKKLLAGEEKDFFIRLRQGGGKIFYVPEAKIKHIIPKNRLTKDYFVRVTRMHGVSERARTLGQSRVAFMRKILSECFKWFATFVLSFLYVLGFQPAKAGYLFLLRWNVTLGLLGFSKR